MDGGILIPLLAFGTLGAVIAFAWTSKIKTDERRRSESTRSTLASDAPDRAQGASPPDV